MAKNGHAIARFNANAPKLFVKPISTLFKIRYDNMNSAGKISLLRINMQLHARNKHLNMDAPNYL